jgi:hypothetical protein
MVTMLNERVEIDRYDFVIFGVFESLFLVFPIGSMFINHTTSLPRLAGATVIGCGGLVLILSGISSHAIDRFRSKLYYFGAAFIVIGNWLMFFDPLGNFIIQLTPIIILSIIVLINYLWSEKGETLFRR